jgi:hypothetical protein
VLLKLWRVVILVLDDNVNLRARKYYCDLFHVTGGIIYRDGRSSLNWWFGTIIGYNLDNYLTN